jgi:thiol-disulfide isomerase/thioredoxin
MDMFKEIKSLDSLTIIIILLIVIILLLLYLNFKRMVDISSECSCTLRPKLENLENVQPLVIKEKEIKLVSSALEQEHVFAVYYATWCGYSRDFLEEYNNRLLPELEKYPEIKGRVKFVLNDCDKHKELCIKNNIDGFPTLILHKSNGQNVEFNSGTRTTATIIKFIQDNL